MSQTQWTQLPPHDSRSGPALASGAGGHPLLVAVTPQGEVVFTSSTSYADGWEAWAVVNAGAPLGADPDTSPLLLACGNAPYLMCRGADDNLYVTRHVGDQKWESWRQLTTDGSVQGPVSAAFTTTGGRCVHVAYRAVGGQVHCRRYDSSWRQPEPAAVWADGVETQIAADGASEVLLIVRDAHDRMLIRRRAAPWREAWAPVGERRGCQGLSNCVYFAGSFHVAYSFRTLREDIGGGYAHFLAHARFRASQHDDRYHRVIHESTTAAALPATLAVYRNKLVAAFADERIAVRAAYWDSADPTTPWIDLGAVAGGRTKSRPSLVAIDARTGLASDDLLAANYGNDLFASVVGGTMGGVWVINFSRAFLANRMAAIDATVDWCMDYRGSRLMDQCTPTGALPAVAELPVFSEVGFGTMTFPDRLIHPIFRRTLDNAGQTGSYHTWIHPQVLAPSPAWFGPHLNIDYLPDYRMWNHEMGHRLASSIGIWDTGAAHVNPELMADVIPSVAVKEANALFETDTNSAGTCRLGADAEGRCRGFTGIAGPYEVKSVQHAWIYVMQEYRHDGDALRERAYEDLRAGTDLLRRKYDWVRDHIFGGVEFSADNLPLAVATLTNKHSGKALDTVDWDLDDHAALQQYTAHGGANQSWALRPGPEGGYHLVAMHSGKCLDVTSASHENGAAVQLYTQHAGANQIWDLVHDEHGYVEIVARHSGKCLEVAGWSTSERASVQQYDRHGGDNQRWRLSYRVSG